MDFYEAQERARELGFTVNVTNGNRTWFSALKKWDYTDQTFALDVWADKNEFQFIMLEGLIEISTGKLGSFDNDVHFLAWQRRFMEVIEKLA